jgi:hypothetical protein
MPRPWEMEEKLDLVTTDFVYVRWLGDRKGIEAPTTTWDKTFVDRADDLRNHTNYIEVNSHFVADAFFFVRAVPFTCD